MFVTSRHDKVIQRKIYPCASYTQPSSRTHIQHCSVCSNVLVLANWLNLNKYNINWTQLPAMIIIVWTPMSGKRRNPLPSPCVFRTEINQQKKIRKCAENGYHIFSFSQIRWMRCTWLAEVHKTETARVRLSYLPSHRDVRLNSLFFLVESSLDVGQGTSIVPKDFRIQEDVWTKIKRIINIFIPPFPSKLLYLYLGISLSFTHGVIRSMRFLNCFPPEVEMGVLFAEWRP